MTQKSPLPVRNGVNATRLRVPLSGPWHTVHDYVLETFGHIDHGGITRRFDDGDVVDVHGAPLSTSTPLGDLEFLWYYRSAGQEVPLPVTEELIHQDEHLVVVDKPHFLPTTPAGRYVQESLLVRLRNTLDIPDLVPIHRLDRGTAGVVLFSKQPQTRGAYQLLFENRVVEKSYECVSAIPAGMSPETMASRFPLTVRNKIEKTKGVVVSQLASYAPKHSGKRPHDRTARQGKRRTEAIPGANSSSQIELLATGRSHSGPDVGHFRLNPHTGKTHQLRIHMALLGLGILNDRFYPELLDDAPDEFDKPLQLLAKTLSFTDPLSGVPRSFISSRTLQESPQ